MATLRRFSAFSCSVRQFSFATSPEAGKTTPNTLTPAIHSTLPGRSDAKAPKRKCLALAPVQLCTRQLAVLSKKPQKRCVAVFVSNEQGHVIGICRDLNLTLSWQGETANQGAIGYATQERIQT